MLPRPVPPNIRGPVTRATLYTNQPLFLSSFVYSADSEAASSSIIVVPSPIMDSASSSEIYSRSFPGAACFPAFRPARRLGRAFRIFPCFLCPQPCRYSAKKSFPAKKKRSSVLCGSLSDQEVLTVAFGEICGALERIKEKIDARLGAEPFDLIAPLMGRE